MMNSLNVNYLLISHRREKPTESGNEVRWRGQIAKGMPKTNMGLISEGHRCK